MAYLSGMSNKLCRILFLVVILPSFTYGQETRIDIEEFPPLDTVWGSVQYKQVLLSF